MIMKFGEMMFLLSVLATSEVSHAGDAHGGVMLWSWGRSATDEFAYTSIRTLGWKYCNGAKEGLKSGLNQTALQNCIEKNEKFAHVKPYFLNTSWSQLRTTKHFFDASMKAGFSIVVTIYRDNALHQKLSSFGLSFSKFKEGSRDRNEFAEEYFCTGRLKKQLESDRKIWEEGVIDALRAGFKILPLTFTDVTQDTCGSVQRLLDVAFPTQSPMRSRPCRFSMSPHTKTSYRPPTIEERVGSAAYACILDELQDDPKYSWMLDPHAETPPRPTWL